MPALLEKNKQGRSFSAGKHYESKDAKGVDFGLPSSPGDALYSAISSPPGWRGRRLTNIACIEARIEDRRGLPAAIAFPGFFVGFNTFPGICHAD